MVACVELNSCTWLTKGSLYSVLFNVTSNQPVILLSDFKTIWYHSPYMLAFNVFHICEVIIDFGALLF